MGRNPTSGQLGLADPSECEPAEACEVEVTGRIAAPWPRSSLRFWRSLAANPSTAAAPYPLVPATHWIHAPTSQLDAATSRLDAPTRQIVAPSTPIVAPTGKIVVFNYRLDAPTLDFDVETQIFDAPAIQIDAATIRFDVFTSANDVETLILDFPGLFWLAERLPEVVNGFREQLSRVKDLLGVVLGLSLTILVAETLEVATRFRHELAADVAQPFESVFVMNRG